MNKTTIFFLLILLTALSLGGAFVYADENKNETNVKSNAIIGINNDSNVFEMSGEGKNKTQFRIKDNHNNENSEFIIKGVITTSTSDSITIDGKTINIDSFVTEKIKIVGKLEIGAYAMAKGEIIDSKYYAKTIIVNQRNKKDIENDNQDEIVTVSLTPTPPTIALDNDEDQTATMTAQLDFENIINTIQNFLNYLKDLASKI